ncbi:MAG: YggT family protein [Levilactobacillus sp.]|uniref:YggT family protein n=1 Tax=Levilactobacillus suantsaiihabitans TaxID=2487722 RepID=A0A4Z0J9E3_9LACO|nr:MULTISPECIES: YggT family protein [Levilactobacillus]AYM02977.1 YggT family protein [Levilactobacillus brevis]MCH4123123.1 YggT family protein [Levilactobacillus sp.]MCI1552739.1 YggT family protein [Levilactobacillus sp.]MCI1598989.1 YggT family protein [Levilactobacillus sp.]MCI1606938.1 YggT family protein [Levilactobacillus sp.]
MIQFILLLFKVLNWAVSAYILLIVVYALLSWLPGGYQSKFGQIIGRLVEPFLRYFEFVSVGPLGFGPVVAIIVLTLVQYGLSALEQMIFGLIL